MIFHCHGYRYEGELIKEDSLFITIHDKKKNKQIRLPKSGTIVEYD